jgi:hypothetical protein
MELYIKRKLESDVSWESKQLSAILTDNAKNIDPIWEYLVAQDAYWETYKDLIRVRDPLATFERESDLERLCQYCGKTDIYDMLAFMEFCKSNNFDVFLFQTCNEYFC